MAPKGIPPERKQILCNAIEKGFQSPKYHELMKTLGHRTIFYDSKKLAQVIKTEDEKCRKLMEMVGLAVKK